MGTPSHSYGSGTSLAIWDHTMLPATRHKWTHPALTPASKLVAYSISLPRRDGWLNWPRLPVYPAMHRPGVELAIFRSLVRRPTTTLPSRLYRAYMPNSFSKNIRYFFFCRYVVHVYRSILSTSWELIAQILSSVQTAFKPLSAGDSCFIDVIQFNLGGKTMTRIRRQRHTAPPPAYNVFTVSVVSQRRCRPCILACINTCALSGFYVSLACSVVNRVGLYTA